MAKSAIDLASIVILPSNLKDPLADLFGTYLCYYGYNIFRIYFLFIVTLEVSNLLFSVCGISSFFLIDWTFYSSKRFFLVLLFSLTNDIGSCLTSESCCIEAKKDSLLIELETEFLTFNDYPKTFSFFLSTYSTPLFWLWIFLFYFYSSWRIYSALYFWYYYN